MCAFHNSIFQQFPKLFLTQIFIVLHRICRERELRYSAPIMECMGEFVAKNFLHKFYYSKYFIAFTYMNFRKFKP